MTQDQAIEIGRTLARQMFEKRGGHSEVHLSEGELAAACALAAERGAAAMYQPARVKPTRAEFLALLSERLGVVSVRLVDRGMAVSISRPFEASGVESLARVNGLETLIGDNLAEVRIFGFRREPRGADHA